MTDSNNPGQFGNKEGADPQEAGAKGAAAQPQEAKVEGGEKGGSQQKDEDVDEE